MNWNLVIFHGDKKAFLMKKTYILLLGFISLSLFTQNTQDDDQRKGSLFFSLGTQYRITPISTSDSKGGPTTFNHVNTDIQNSGPALFYTLDYYITKNLSLGFSHSMRYDLITMGGHEIQGATGFQSADYGLIFGYTVYLDYHIKAFKNAELVVHLGRSRLNTGTNFTSKQTFYVNNTAVPSYSQEHFAYFAWDFALGYKKKKFSFTIGAYTTSVTNYYLIDNFIVPYFSFKYNLGTLF